MDSNVKLSKLRYLQYLWENVKDVYVEDATERWLDVGCANLERLQKGDYGTGIEAYAKAAYIHTVNTGSWVIDILPMGMSNPANAGKAVNRTYFDVKYGLDYEGKNQNDHLWDKASVLMGVNKMINNSKNAQEIAEKV